MTELSDINILCAGECMMELRSRNDQFLREFAGDIINFAIYLKRLDPSASVHFFSAIGEDSISEKMLTSLHQAAIDTELVFTTPDKTVGLYMVDTDDQGERAFTYWRSDSAARQMFLLADISLLYQSARTANYFYFSGITLAILDQPGRDQLLALANLLNREAKTVVFDPNFRPTLWRSIEEARTQTARAYEASNIVLSSYDDQQILSGESDINSVLMHLTSFDIDEIVLTNGPNEINGIYHGESFKTLPAESTAVVDTTAAGDSFNAAYIVSRHEGNSAKESALIASAFAALVIGHPGAIVPEKVTTEFVLS